MKMRGVFRRGFVKDVIKNMSAYLNTHVTYLTFMLNLHYIRCIDQYVPKVQYDF